MPKYTLEISSHEKIPHDVLVEHISYHLRELMLDLPTPDVKFVREES